MKMQINLWSRLNEKTSMENLNFLINLATIMMGGAEDKVTTE